MLKQFKNCQHNFLWQKKHYHLSHDSSSLLWNFPNQASCTCSLSDGASVEYLFQSSTIPCPSFNRCCSFISIAGSVEVAHTALTTSSPTPAAASSSISWRALWKRHSKHRQLPDPLETLVIHSKTLKAAAIPHARLEYLVAASLQHSSVRYDLDA